MTGTPVIERATPADLPAIAALLRASDLPDAGIEPHIETLFVARDGETIVGASAIECYPDGALLRSVVVAGDRRGTGLGALLTERALEAARERRLERIYLLTETAESYFARRGFQTVTRAAVPASVRTSIEFTTLCPDTATAMVLEPGNGDRA